MIFKSPFACAACTLARGFWRFRYPVAGASSSRRPRGWSGYRCPYRNRPASRGRSRCGIRVHRHRHPWRWRSFPTPRGPARSPSWLLRAGWADQTIWRTGYGLRGRSTPWFQPLAI